MLQVKYLYFGKNHGSINTAAVITAATIWFSVMLDANIPIEIAAIDNSKNPNIITKVGTIFGEAKIH